jgi:hypothetical protein
MSITKSFRRTATIFLTMLMVFALMPTFISAQTSESGSIGIEGVIPSDPPSTPATISTPTNGQGFTELPVTVSGLCPQDLLVKLFKNNVFAGSAQCANGSYSILVDLFNGQNELVARVFDALDQQGPDSNIVTVTFTDNRGGAFDRPTLSSNFAKRGANPGQALVWPIILSGGTGPYAVSVDWGDGSTPDLISQPFPGTFDISHTYDKAGTYNIIIKVTDANGASAFLQLVGVANGPLSQTDGGQAGTGDPLTADSNTKVRILWEPAAITIPFILSTFWLGKKYELKVLRRRIERGERPF